MFICSLEKTKTQCINNYLLEDLKGDSNLSIVIHLDRLVVDHNLKMKDLADQVSISQANLSKIKQDKSKLIRFSTLESLCEILKCQPGDLLEYKRK